MSTEPSLGSACHQPPNAPGQLTVPTLPRRMKSALSVSSTTETPKPNPRPTAKGFWPSHPGFARWLSVQLIGHHRGERFRTQETHAIHLTVTQEEPREIQIVVERGPQPGAAGFVGHILRPFCDEHATPGDSFGQPALFIEAIRSRTASPAFPGGPGSLCPSFPAGRKYAA